MTKPRWYSPQLSREIVSRLYYEAKAEHIPMTVLANRMIGHALASSEAIAIAEPNENKAAMNSKIEPV